MGHRDGAEAGVRPALFREVALFTIKALRKGPHDNNDNRAGDGISVVDDLLTRPALILFRKCLMARLTLRHEGRRAGETKEEVPPFHNDRTRA